MNESDIGIKKEVIFFLSNQTASSTIILEMKFTLTGSSFKTEFRIFLKANPDELLHFYMSLTEQKVNWGYKKDSRVISSYCFNTMLPMNGIP